MGDIFSAAGVSADAPPPYISVSEFLRDAKATLEAGMREVWVMGEVGNVTRAASGHWYFSIKDEDGQLDCVMLARWNREAEGCPQTGDKVLVRGAATLYAPRGRFQMAVKELQFAGAGRLHQLFLQRKQEWHARGWFANARPLPPLPRALGVVCSTSGAALQDVLRTLKARMPLLRVIIYPAPAQGEGAAEKIAAMLRAASRRGECEALLLVRGGGSLEDLWAYNEEAVVLAVHQCAVPVVSGIGHEIDHTLADYAADLRCPTPTAAAAAAVPAAAELQQQMAAAEKLLHRRLQALLDDGAQRLDWAQRLLGEPQRLLAHKQTQLRAARQALLAAASLAARQSSLAGREQTLALLSPQRLLAHKQAQLDARRTALTAAASLVARQTALAGRAQALELLSPQRLLAHKQAQLDALRTALTAAASLVARQTALAGREQALELLSPQRLLQRGYSIVTDAGGAVVRRVQQARSASALTLRLSDGEVPVAPLPPSPPR